MVTVLRQVNLNLMPIACIHVLPNLGMLKDSADSVDDDDYCCRPELAKVARSKFFP